MLADTAMDVAVLLALAVDGHVEVTSLEPSVGLEDAWSQASCRAFAHSKEALGMQLVQRQGAPLVHRWADYFGESGMACSCQGSSSVT